jgi:uncharacterized protein YaeQ
MALATFQSTNFQVQYESTDYTQDELLILQPVAQALPNECEPDYATLCGWFGIPVGEGFGPGNRTVVTLTKNVRGASNTGYSPNNSQMSVNPNLGGSADFVQSLFVAEMIEILMRYTGGNWDPLNSGGEGLSRVAAEILHPMSAPATKDNNVNAWLAFDPTQDPTSAKADTEYRKDWISVNFTGGDLRVGGFVPGDQDSYSFGCAMLFTYYLKDQRGYTMAEIVQNGMQTLGGTYQQLTKANSTGYAPFKRLLDANFPLANPASTTDDPFPLPFIPGDAALDDPPAFDVEFYLHHYPDLWAAFGDNPAAARQHWRTQGLPNEGRRGSREFDVQFYLTHYADLQNVFGTNYALALDHWLKVGLPNEARRGSREFDVQFYLSRYADLQNAFGTDYVAALNHWRKLGLQNEGRRGSREFDVQAYLSIYGDLQNAFGKNFTAALDHWINLGLPNEGRRGCREFEVKSYLNHYVDLQNAFGTNYTAALDHWISPGLPNEGRRGSREFDVQFYLNRYADLQNAFGKNFTAALDHFIRQGLPQEGRAGALEVDVTFYLGNYPDLQNAFGGNFPSAIDHWISLGLPVEGRRAALKFDVQFYLAKYPDLQAAFGNDFAAAFDHWVRIGISEGRQGAP